MRLKVVLWAVAADIIGILFSKVHINVSSDESWNKHEEISSDVLHEKSFRTSGPEAAFVFQAAIQTKEKSIMVWTWCPAVFTDRIYILVLGDKSLMIVDIDGPFTVVGDSHAGSNMCIGEY